jgi:prepilin peptidase CpaA
MTHLVAGSLVVLAIAAAMAVDVATFRIPNVLPVALVVLFAFAAVTSPHPLDWLGHFGTGLLMFALGAACFAVRFMGGGDVKLLAAVSLWFGWSMLAEYLLIVGLIGGVFGGALLLTRRYAPFGEPYLYRLGLSLPRVLRQGEAIPYGLAIGAGALVLMATSGSFGGP